MTLRLIHSKGNNKLYCQTNYLIFNFYFMKDFDIIKTVDDNGVEHVKVVQKTKKTGSSKSSDSEE